MSEQVEARVTGEFIHAGDGQRYGDGETCMVSEDALERHPAILERVDGEADEADTDDRDPDEGNLGGDSSTATDENGAELTDLTGVGEATADALREAGFGSVADVQNADPDALAEVSGISESHADALING